MRKSTALADFRSGSRTPPMLEPDETIRVLERNQMLFEAGDAKTDLFRIERGMVCLFTVRWDGRRDVIEFAFPGDIVGLGFLAAHACSAQAVVETRLRCLPLEAADCIDPDDTRAATRYNAAITREFDFRRASLVAGSRGRPVARLAALLLALSRRYVEEGRDPTLIDGVIDAEIVARQLGLSLDQLAHAAVQLEARGCVKAAPGRCMRLTDMQALEAITDPADA
jgi:CRP/FNR family transcriptional regulator